MHAFTLIISALCFHLAASVGYGKAKFPQKMAEESEVKINDIRKEAGLSTLCMQEDIRKAAAYHNGEMKQMNLLTHDDLEGSMKKGKDPLRPRLARFGVKKATRIAENAARGQSNSTQLVKGWMNSPGHRKNILTPGLNAHGLASDGSFSTHLFAFIPGLKCGAQQQSSKGKSGEESGKGGPKPSSPGGPKDKAPEKKENLNFTLDEQGLEVSKFSSVTVGGPRKA